MDKAEIRGGVIFVVSRHTVKLYIIIYNYGNVRLGRYINV